MSQALACVSYTFSAVFWLQACLSAKDGKNAKRDSFRLRLKSPYLLLKFWSSFDVG